jgi:hypothetical protein
MIYHITKNDGSSVLCGMPPVAGRFVHSHYANFDIIEGEGRWCLRCMKSMSIKYEYELLADYGDGWEVATTEENKKGILARMKEYRENAPKYSYRYRRVRV